MPYGYNFLGEYNNGGYYGGGALVTYFGDYYYRSGNWGNPGYPPTIGEANASWTPLPIRMFSGGGSISGSGSFGTASVGPVEQDTGFPATFTYTENDFTAQSPGGVFTMAGSGFVGVTLVRVSGTIASFTVLSNSSLQVTMPAGLIGTSGPVYCEKPSGSSASLDWVTGTA